MSPCKKGSRGARAAISEGGWGLRRGSPLGDSSSSSQGKGWELVNNPGTPGTGMLIISPWTDTTKLLTRSCSPRVGGSDNWTTSCLVVLGDQVPSVLFQKGKEQWGLELWKRARDLAPYRWSSPGLTLSTEAAQNLLTKAINSAPAQIPWRSSPKQFLLCGFHYFSPKS